MDKTHSPPYTHPVVLSIAGSDSGGCAGIQADLKTFSALECFGTTAITAVTAQNTLGVTNVFPVTLTSLRQQIVAVLDDIGANAVKVGMLHSAGCIRAVTDLVRTYAVEKLVVDPVMVATSGDLLLQHNAIAVLRDRLIPHAMVITPNLPEAALLLGRDLHNAADYRLAARNLCDFGCRAALVKGGHADGDALLDVFYDSATDQLLEFRSPRVATNNTHGTGCTLAAAIAAFLARGCTLHQAVAQGREYLINALIRGAEYKVGRGSGPVHHFHNWWD